MILALKPKPRRSLMLRCVGFVFWNKRFKTNEVSQRHHILHFSKYIYTTCSPTTLSTGTKVTWIRQKFSGPTLCDNWLSASVKGQDSFSPANTQISLFYIQKILTKKSQFSVLMLPIVPPNSMMQTSGGPSFPSTGIIATLSTHSRIVSVMWGTI